VRKGAGELAITGSNNSDKRVKEFAIIEGIINEWAWEVSIIGRNNSDKRTGQVAIIGWITVRIGQGRLQ
jgi:hypothetical protein